MPKMRSFDPDSALRNLADLMESAAQSPNINRWTSLPAQDLFVRSQTKRRALIGGNQSGKTATGVYDDCLILTHRHPYRQHLYGMGPLNIRFIGVDFERGIDQGAIPYFRQFLPASSLVNGSWEDSYRASEHMLTLADGSTCSFMSYEQDPNKFQIVRLHHIHFDEEPPKAIYDESMPRLLKHDGTWTLSETPVQQLEWVQDEILDKALPPEGDGTRPDVEVFRLDTRDNVHLSSEALETMTAGLSAEQKLIRILGQYTSSSLVFPEFHALEPFVIPGAGFVPYAHEWAVYESMDHGYSSPTAWLWTAINHSGQMVTFREMYAPLTLVSTWAELVKQTRREIATLIGADPDTWAPSATIGDPAIAQRSNGVTGVTVQQEYARHGIYIGTEGIVKQRSGNQNVGLARMHEALALVNGKPRWQLTDNCPNLTSEMRRARKPKMTAKQHEQRNDSEQIRDKDNHAIDAAKYLHMLSYGMGPAGSAPKERIPADALPEELRNAAQFAPATTTEIMRATLRANPWRVSSSDGSDYSDLE